MALQSNPSDWENGNSAPSDFTADAVVEVLSNADADEVNRIKGADDRETVQSAAGDRLDALGNADENPDANDDVPGPGDPNEENSSVADNQEAADENRDMDSDDYDPFTDPDLDSVLAQIVSDERAGGNGESPTLEAVKEAKNSSK
jgi:hypothetical protein